MLGASPRQGPPHVDEGGLKTVFEVRRGKTWQDVSQHSSDLGEKREPIMCSGSGSIRDLPAFGSESAGGTTSRRPSPARDFCATPPFGLRARRGPRNAPPHASKCDAHVPHVREAVGGVSRNVYPFALVPSCRIGSDSPRLPEPPEQLRPLMPPVASGKSPKRCHTQTRLPTRHISATTMGLPIRSAASPSLLASCARSELGAVTCCACV